MIGQIDRVLLAKVTNTKTVVKELVSKNGSSLYYGYKLKDMDSQVCTSITQMENQMHLEMNYRKPDGKHADSQEFPRRISEP